MSNWIDRRFETIESLSAEAETKRARFYSLLGLTRERMRPSNLAKDAGNKLLDLGLDVIDKSKASALAHPAKTAGIAAAIGAFLARKPLMSLMVSAYAHIKGQEAGGRDNEEIADTVDDHPNIEGDEA